MNDREWLALCLNSAIQDRGLSKADAARKAGIARQTLYNVLNAKGSLSVDLLFQIVRGWNCPEIWVLLGQRH